MHFRYSLRVLLVLGAGAVGCGDDDASSTSSSSASAVDASYALDGGASSVMDAGLRLSDIPAPTLVGDQFFFTEGPVWDPKNNVLYFTDINAVSNSLDGGVASGAIYRLTPPNAFDVVLQPAGNADGLALDPAGNLLAAGFASRNAWRLTPMHTMQVLGPCAEGSQSCFAGQPLNTPDDITARSDGTLYFTDPTFGSGAQGFPVLSLPLQAAQGVYRVTPDGVLHLEDSTPSGPNGVNLSPDQKTLYVSYTLTSEVAKFDVAADGSLSNKSTFASMVTLADSMCVDAAGNLYVGTVGGLAVYAPDGTSLGTVSVGGMIVTNCAFGGSDQKTLFVTTRTLKTLTGVPPLGGGSLYQISNMPVSGIPGQN